MSDVAAIEKLVQKRAELKKEISKIIVGQNEVVDQILLCIFSGGHALLVGVPGLAKTLMVNTIAQALGLDFKRIQFTPDLMPSDILGSEILDENRQFKFIKGPLFANIILADEINRTPPKTQAALLEAMQERAVTIAGVNYKLALPYFVLATQNPIEQEGTYPLPEAQLDRFMFAIKLDYPTFAEEVQVVKSTTNDTSEKINPLFTAQEIIDFQHLIRRIPGADNVIEYAVTLVSKTRPDNTLSNEYVKNYLDWGAGPRASQNLILAAKAHAAFNGKFSPDIEDVKAYRRAPVLLGRVITIRGEKLDESSVPPEERWVTRGETPMTFMRAKPPEALLRSGEWWPENYEGPMLVSVEEDAASGLGLKLGDSIGFRIFGREIEAKVSSLRKVDWTGFGANVAFILSPGALEAIKPFNAAIVIMPPDKEAEVIAAVSSRWPMVLAFQLRKTLETAADLFGQVSIAVAALAGVVTTAGVLVLFGAFAAAARRRRRESALLKVFGASRAAILGLYAFEFALAAFVAVFLGALMGVVAAHPIVILVFDVTWRFDWSPVVTGGLIAVISAAAGGAIVGWSTLSQRPARVLRSA